MFNKKEYDKAHRVKIKKETAEYWAGYYDKNKKKLLKYKKEKYLENKKLIEYAKAMQKHEKIK